MAKAIDLTGKIYGKWKILERKGTSKSGFAKWLCECECGNKKTFISIEIRKKHARKDCGCSKSWIGKKFGMLTVLENGVKSNHNEHILCKCDCGTIKKTWGGHLPRGRIVSCGCKRKKNLEQRALIVILNSYKRHAKRRNQEFNLKENDFKNLLASNCFYCGNHPQNKFKRKTQNQGDIELNYNGIDRKDNTKGYEQENIVTCCRICNLMKRDLSIVEWFEHMKKIGNNIKNNLELAQAIKALNKSQVTQPAGQGV